METGGGGFSAIRGNVPKAGGMTGPMGDAFTTIKVGHARPIGPTYANPQSGNIEFTRVNPNPAAGALGPDGRPMLTPPSDLKKKKDTAAGQDARTSTTDLNVATNANKPASNIAQQQTAKNTEEQAEEIKRANERQQKKDEDASKDKAKQDQKTAEAKPIETNMTGKLDVNGTLVVDNKAGASNTEVNKSVSEFTKVLEDRLNKMFKHLTGSTAGQKMEDTTPPKPPSG